MASILVIVFVLQLAIHLVNTVGAVTIDSLLWYLYNCLPTPTSRAAADQRRLQKDFLLLRKELNATSSQDEFAKWAKLRRQHDKVLEQLEKSKSSLSSAKAIFDRSVSTVRWLGTNGLRFVLQWWYTKEAMFWLPQGWLPYYAEWLLSFPRAPLGSVSIQAWVVACGAVIILVSDAILVAIELVMQSSTTSGSRTKAEPPIVTGERPTSQKTSSTSSERKKKL